MSNINFNRNLLNDDRLNSGLLDIPNAVLIKDNDNYWWVNVSDTGKHSKLVPDTGIISVSTAFCQ